MYPTRTHPGLGFLPLLACLAAGCGGEPSEPSSPPDPAPAPSVVWLTEITEETGLDFTHEAGAGGGLHLPEIVGPGAALFDYDDDGDLDVYLIQGNATLPEGGRADSPTNRLFRQESNGRLADVTSVSGLGDGGYGMGVAIGDIDNDGHLDVYLSNYASDRLYRNRGDGTFEDLTERAGIHVDGWSTSAAFLDYDRDGFLDLYVAQYVADDPDSPCFDHAGRPDYCGPNVYPAVHDVLLHNEGDGSFRDVTELAGIAGVQAAGFGIVCEDLNDDGWIDVYVANDGYANQLWINQHDGTFIDEALLWGVAYNLNGDAEAGMGVVSADFDGDALPDLFMTHLRGESNTLYRNFGDGFRDDSGPSGLGGTSLRYTGFGTVAFDVDLDGDLDVAVANGRVARGNTLEESVPSAPWDTYAEPNLFYLNDGDARFSVACREAGSFCHRVEITRGLAAGDIDSDGDVDLLLTNVQGPARLYRNDAPRSGHWLLVRAVDPALGRDAIGARITLYAGSRRQVRTIGGGFSYLSSSDPRAHFGLGPLDAVDRIVVRWPDGVEETFSGTPVNRVVELRRGEADAP